jgi:predicted nucleic-acid-binding Zn-ribbon protein
VAKWIKETKNTCKACGNVWFYGKQEVKQQKAAAMQNAGKGMMCCGGCLPAALIPDKKVIDLSKCPKCGSKAVVCEKVTHRV